MPSFRRKSRGKEPSSIPEACVREQPRAEEEAEGLIRCWGGGDVSSGLKHSRGSVHAMRAPRTLPGRRPWVTGPPPDYLLIMTPAGGGGGELRQKSWSSPELSHRGRRGSWLPPLHPGSCLCYLGLPVSTARSFLPLPDSAYHPTSCSLPRISSLATKKPFFIPSALLKPSCSSFCISVPRV